MKEEAIMQTTTASSPTSPALERPQRYRVHRRFSTQRRLEELVRDLLRAHSGE